MEKFLIKIANIELLDEDWERVTRAYEGTDFTVMVDQTRGVGGDNGFLVVDNDKEPDGDYIRVLAKMSGGLLWDQMMPPAEDEDNIPEATDNDKILLSHNEEIYLCEEV